MLRKFMYAGVVLMFCVGLVVAQNGGAGVDATVKLIDVERGKAVISIVEDGRIRIMEISITADTKIVTPKGKKIKGGLKSDVFKSDRNDRNTVPVKIQFENVDGKQVVKKIIVP